ncbi:MAG TPA: hypothetical protein VF704_00270 [Allosphingosinicella sp.]|jgi:drug/metabolite transporter (DMT)-like permease
MEIVDATRFVIGIAFAVAGAGVLIVARGSRGFNQRRQAGVLFLVGSVVFVAVGLGLIGD